MSALPAVAQMSPGMLWVQSCRLTHLFGQASGGSLILKGSALLTSVTWGLGCRGWLVRHIAPCGYPRSAHGGKDSLGQASSVLQAIMSLEAVSQVKATCLLSRARGVQGLIVYVLRALQVAGRREMVDRSLGQVAHCWALQKLRPAAMSGYIAPSDLSQTAAPLLALHA